MHFSLNFLRVYRSYYSINEQNKGVIEDRNDSGTLIFGGNSSSASKGQKREVEDSAPKSPPKVQVVDKGDNQQKVIRLEEADDIATKINNLVHNNELLIVLFGDYGVLKRVA